MMRRNWGPRLTEPVLKKDATWLTLGAAGTLLGVSESTVRRWADAGDVRSYRTSGGHRRILEEDLRHMVGSVTAHPPADSARISDLAVARIKRRLGRSRSAHSNPAVLEDLALEVRERLRILGRQLVDMFARYIASGRRRDRFVDDARMIGREYGRTLVGNGVGLTTAVTTFNSLRHSIDETASQIASEAGLPADEAVEAIENILSLADVVLEGMAEVYESATSR